VMLSAFSRVLTNFAIAWPSDVEVVCNPPVPAPARDPLPVHLSEIDRGRGLAIPRQKYAQSQLQSTMLCRTTSLIVRR
jgi:hypothetical protein